MKRKLTILLSLAMVFSALMGSVALAAPTPAPRDFDTLAPGGVLSADAVTAKYAILIDANTGKVLYEKEADTKTYPASTTKIMTCMLAVEKATLTDTVTIGSLPALPSDATNIALKKGETLSVEELLYGLMLRSGNDAADALAIHISGSIENFATVMNQRAQELGMTGTHYVNPHGLHDAEHYTTARDMATLARAARQYPMFQKLVSTYRYTMRATNKNTQERTWYNTNRLISQDESEIYAYEYATGIKTGYTNPAGSCLVASAKKGDVELIAVALSDSTTGKWVSCTTMFEYGFQFYDTVDLGALLSDQEITVDIPNAALNDETDGALSVLSVAQKSAYITDTKDAIAAVKGNPSAFRQEITPAEGLSAPIEKDQAVGTVTYYYKDEAVLVCDLLATRAVAAQPASTPVVPHATQVAGTQPTAAPSATKHIGVPWYVYALVISVLVLVFVLILYLLNASRAKKYRQYTAGKGNRSGNRGGRRPPSSARSRRR
ncbi:MAG: D-alanyl-D-alanine carboxypeptidase [Eubacteriales bacterium]|nr:D-alanyl-D-alanine carboxypeptidase [Eubacteriales bacterium]